VRLFKVMQQANPELARQCYALAERALVESGEFATCTCYLDDLEGRVEAILRSYQTTLSIAGEGLVLGAPQAGLKAYAKLRLGEEARRLIAILEGAGRFQDADRLRESVRAQEES
jgi:hypothetical protein